VSSSDHCGAASRYLSRIAIRLRGKIRLVERISSRMVELDIAACRIEREIAADWAKNRNKINEQLDKLGMSEAEWCRRELGCSIQTMRRRVQLLKGWTQYLKRRREVGDNGQYGCSTLHLLPRLHIGPNQQLPLRFGAFVLVVARSI
jgi:hypothetical protein